MDMSTEASPSDLVIGVAGHIDHGKTALVRALTGIDTDRLPEEKTRGITIELGFAHLVLPGGRRAAIVDMPGHERFIRAMIAGAGGLDVCLLVVASNEGVMPQTREHLAVAELLGVRAGVIALSKSDLAGEDVLELAVEEVREVLAGTFLDSAEIVAVSAHTGHGLDALRAALARAAVPSRSSDGPALLPVDRVFVRKGFGTVATGTLVSGVLSDGDVMVVGPLGMDERVSEVRVRSLQIHGQPVERAHAGTRVAVNLVGIEVSELPRGAWLFRQEELSLTRSFDAEIHTLKSCRKPFARRTHLELAVGAAHAGCTVALLEGEELAPGERAIARITTDRPIVMRPGERFVLRGPAAMAGFGSIVGGGTVLRPVAERVRRRELALARARSISVHEDSLENRARTESEAAGPRGLSQAQLSARLGATASDEVIANAGLMRVGNDRFVGESVVTAVSQRVLQALSLHHADVPASRGLEHRALRALADESLLECVLRVLVEQKKISRSEDLYCRTGWKPRDPDAVPHLASLAASFASAGITPPRNDELALALKTDLKGLEPALKRLIERREIVKISHEFHGSASALDALEAALIAHLEREGSIDAQGFKTLTGASRKWTIPLAEYFDAKKVTLRVGDVRKLRGR
ncbi:MAG: selenocysteine-specific translation elongation factor [Deltaproteobacteria bacterium]|nr:selenocysteine-specific translation elongation factor [Deltaproteobacteria bacterium]